MSRRPERIAGVADVDCSGKTVLFTGSTSGIGRAAALALGRLGADVVVHGRDQEAGADVVEKLSRTGVDATVLAYTARPGPGELRSLPPDPPTDPQGLPMRIVYRSETPLAGE